MTAIAQEVETFAATEGSSHAMPPFPEHLVEELAQILADALHEDIKQYPSISDIPAVTESTVVSRRGSARRSGRRSRTQHQDAASQ
jgi:hypothetical protein